MPNTFPGGIHPKEYKEISENKAISIFPVPKIAVIPLLQHNGAINEPLVNVGDQVKIGQILGSSEKFVSSPVHASIAGKITAIEDRLSFNGLMIKSIIIENDGSSQIHESIKPYPELEKLSKDDIRKIVRGAGIVGLGGAAFPTHIKLDPPHDKEINTVILNGAECEPFLTCDYRVLLEDFEDVILGLKAIMIPTDAKSGIIAIEDNKPEAIKLFEKLLAKEEHISLKVVKTKYPQGAEKQLIKSILKREVPSGGLPMDVGVVVNNIGTAAQIAKTLKTGMPLIERVVTIAGTQVKNPANLLVKIGTNVRELIEFSQVNGTVRKVLAGGPMMGIAIPSLDVPVVKALSGLTIFTEKDIRSFQPDPCIRCGKCVDICPMNLQPNLLADLSEHEKWAECEKLHALDCIECGACAYVCGAKRNLVQLIKKAKAQILKRRKKKS